MKKKISSFILLLASLTSCNKYLEIIPKGKFIPETVADFEDLSANPSYSSSEYALLERMSDGIYMPDTYVKSGFNTSSSKTYIWAESFYVNPETDNGWDPNYANIFNANIILQNIPKLPANEKVRIDQIKGDAYCNRASAYLNLILLYAPVYQESRATSDLGVPILTEPDLEAKPKRASSKEVYDFILNDLIQAEQLLPDQAKNIYRNDKKTAQAILARIYLQMGNYVEALAYAQKVLMTKSTLLDYNTWSFINPTRPHSGITNRPLPQDDSERIAYRTTSFGSALINTCISPDLLAGLDKKDLRFKFFWSELESNGKPTKEPYPVYIKYDLNFNIGVPEMMLIAAECQARLGKVNEALSYLNKLREKRFTPTDFKTLQAATAETALKLVIQERQIELFGRGQRWFDMKRLDKDPLFKKDYKRANIEGSYTLKQGSPKFVCQIPPKVLLMNSNIVPNPR